VAANGLRAGSGFTVGLLGAAIGMHWSLGLSSAALCAGTVVAGLYALRPPRGPRTASPPEALGTGPVPQPQWQSDPMNQETNARTDR
jgi:hypothetical protein